MDTARFAKLILMWRLNAVLAAVLYPASSASRSLRALMEFAKNVLISVTRCYAQGCVQVCVLAVRPVLPSHGNQPQQPIGSPTSCSWL